jgi:diguanylate cyclase (GGDEF)-like protein
MTERTPPGELVPVEDRIRWMLLCRIVLAAAVVAVWRTTPTAHGEATAWLSVAAGWTSLSVLSAVAARFGRRSARTALTVTLLGDGALLGIAWWATGALSGFAGYAVLLHAVAVTLLASFRTGVKLAVWHAVVALLLLEATAAGLLGPASPVPLAGLAVYLAALWTAVLGTASFAAMNERELRRRRYDSEALRDFGLAIGSATGPAAVVGALAGFAAAELSGRRAAVLAYTRDGEGGRGIGAVAEGAGPPVTHHVGEGASGPGSVVPVTSAATTALLSRLDPTADPWLSGALPGARDLIVVPFRLEQVAGALVVEARPQRLPQRRPRRRSERRSERRFRPWSARRVERRIVGTAGQATAHAAVALERAVLIDQIRAASETDGLTRVANRRRFDEVLPAALERARADGTDLALVMIDIDHFKRLNDTHGHQVGDEVLRQVAQVIRAECGEPHTVARYGGEEFAAVLVGVDPVAALATAERIRAAIAAAPTTTPVTASLGVASCPAHGEKPVELIAAADAALYRAKAAGRDRALPAYTGTPPIGSRDAPERPSTRLPAGR